MSSAVAAALPFPSEVIDAGHGPATLSLHPLAQGARYHDPLVDALGGGLRLVAYDQRGHGAAAGEGIEGLDALVRDAGAVADAVGGPIHLVGHSLGGAVAAELAAARPGAFASLTLVASPARGLPVFARRARAEADGGFDALEAETLRRWFSGADGPFVAEARAAMRRMRPAAWDAAWRALASFGGFGPIAARLPRTMVVAFAQDVSTPPAMQDEIAAILAAAGVDVRRVDIPEAGHFGLLQRPAAVAAALMGFIGGPT